MIQRKEIHVSGRVQGVYFRVFTQRQANALGLVGSVKNLADGRVQIDAQGEEEALNLFVNWCNTGSPLSKVTSVEVTPKSELLSSTTFDITR
ncbi:MAG: acylphosphatase [Bacteroidia bacterium]|nr:acylphosphatase [Bacteroidia bacterium]